MVTFEGPKAGLNPLKTKIDTLKKNLERSIKGVLYQVEFGHCCEPLVKTQAPICNYYDWMGLRMDHPFVSKLQKAFKKMPEKANKYSFETWKSVSRSVFKLILKNWHVVEPDLPLFDGHMKFANWTNEYGAYCVGSRHTGNNERHGIVRTVSKEGKIREASYMRGKAHGLDIFYGEDNVSIRLYRDSSLIASLWFDRHFQETYRDGVEFDGITPEQFKNPNYIPKPDDQRRVEETLDDKIKTAMFEAKDKVAEKK